jgi:hypothetical protein
MSQNQIENPVQNRRLNMTATTNVFQNHIGGKWQAAESGKNFANSKPTTGEILGYFPLSGEADANAAVAAARAG